MRALFWIGRLVVRRGVGLMIGVLLVLFFGRSRTTKTVRRSAGIFRRLTRL